MEEKENVKSTEVVEKVDNNVDNKEVKEAEKSNVNDLEAKIKAELEAKYEAEKQREIDKRVTEAVKKREAKYKAEQAEKERLSKLSEEERVREVQAQKEKELEARHKELIAKELKLDLVDILSENDLPLQFRDIIDVNKYVGVKAEDRRESLKNDINIFKDTFNSIIDKRVEEIKKEYLKGNSPTNLDKKVKPLSAYEEAKKKKDVKGMLNAKFNK